MGGMGAAGSPFEKGPLQKQASHMCKMHLVKINTGFVFSIKKKANKNPVTALEIERKTKLRTPLSRRIKKGMKYWFIQSTAACGLKITLFVKKGKSRRRGLTVARGLGLPAKVKSELGPWCL